MTVYLLSFVNIIVSYATLIIMFQFNDVNNSINTNYWNKHQCQHRTTSCTGLHPMRMNDAVELQIYIFLTQTADKTFAVSIIPLATSPLCKPPPPGHLWTLSKSAIVVTLLTCILDVLGSTLGQYVHPSGIAPLITPRSLPSKRFPVQCHYHSIIRSY
jgi:hypothetical protein